MSNHGMGQIYVPQPLPVISITFNYVFIRVCVARLVMGELIAW
jgi:hypothetical protein